MQTTDEHSTYKAIATFYDPLWHPQKCHIPMRAGSYLLCCYILFCTKPGNLTARAWPFSIDFNNFGCGTKKCTQVDGKLLYYYYKSWPNNADSNLNSDAMSHTKILSYTTAITQNRCENSI